MSLIKGFDSDAERLRIPVPARELPNVRSSDPWLTGVKQSLTNPELYCSVVQFSQRGRVNSSPLSPTKVRSASPSIKELTTGQGSQGLTTDRY